MPLNNLITFRRGTSQEWSNADPILGNGEPGWDVTNNVFKIGDGVHSWTELNSLNNKTLRASFLLNSPTSSFNVDGGYSVGALDVFMNGVKLSPSGDYVADDGESFTLSETAPSGSLIEYLALSPGLSLSTSTIIDFNSSVSGLIPVNNIIAGSGIDIQNNSGIFTINSSGLGSSNISASDVMDIVSTGIIAGTGILLDYDNESKILEINIDSYPITGYEILSEQKNTFNVSPNYNVNNLQVYYNGLKLLNGIDYTANDGSTIVLATSGAIGDVVEWIGTHTVSPVSASSYTDIGVLSNNFENTIEKKITTKNSNVINIFDNQLKIPLYCLWMFKLNILCYDDNRINVAILNFRGCLKKNNFGIFMVDSIKEEHFIDEALNQIDINLSANQNTGNLDISLFGLENKTLHWTATIDIVQKML